MEGSIECFDTLICSGARRLTGYQRRLFTAEVTTELCEGSARQAERRFGWGRETVLKGLHESRQGIRCLENFAARGRLRSEEKDPQLAADIRAIVEPHTYADPQLKSSRRYTNLSAAEVREALIATGHPSEKLPSERTLRDILNRHGPSLRKVAQRTHPAGHPQSHELPAEADSERQTAEEDQRDRRDFRQREGGAATGSQRSRNPGDLHGHQGEGGTGRLCSWGEKPGPTATVK